MNDHIREQNEIIRSRPQVIGIRLGDQFTWRGERRKVVAKVIDGWTIYAILDNNERIDQWELWNELQTHDVVITNEGNLI
jgi:hypothetical protein